MKLLIMTRLAGGLLGRSGSASGSGMINRRRCFVDLVPRSRHMVATVTPRTELEPSGQPQARAPPAADDLRWMVLNRWGTRSDSTASSAVPDDKTAAESRTSWGRPLRVSLGRAVPPAISSICFNRDDEPSGEDSNDEKQSSDDDDDASHGSGSEDGDDDHQSPAYDDDILHVVAAHGDSVLLKMSLPCKVRDRLGIHTMNAPTDYFLYRTATGQPPTLSLLPACHVAMYDQEGEGQPDDFFRTERVFDVLNTGVLRCGSGDEDGDREVLVAQLQVAHKPPFDSGEICVLRPGRRDWELKAVVPIVHNEGGGRHDLGRWMELNGAVPAGNLFLCWVNYDCSTLLVCDVVDEDNPVLRYVPLPVKAVPPDEDENEWPDDKRVKLPLPWEYYRSIGSAGTIAGAAAAPVVRFVSIDNRCCCGAPLRASVCEHSRSAFVVTTWTMALNSTGEPLEWVKESVLDCEELWGAMLAAGYDDIPRVLVSCPIVSPENPDVVSFMAEDIDNETNGSTKSWTLQVDMRRRTLVSVVSSCDRSAHPIQWDLCQLRQTICQHMPAEAR